MAEGIVDGEEEPGIATLGDDRAGKARRQRVAVVDPRCLGRRAGFAGEGRAADRAGDGDAVAFSRELLDGKRHRGIVEADGHIDVFRIEPAAGDCRADVGLVLVVGDGDLDRLAEHRTAGILDRHARRNRRAGTAQVGIEARLIVEHTDFENVVGDLTARARRAAECASKGREKRDWKSQNGLPHTHLCRPEYDRFRLKRSYANILVERDLFGKPASTFPDHALRTGGLCVIPVCSP
jgi:hypothetical protein